MSNTNTLNPIQDSQLPAEDDGSKNKYVVCLEGSIVIHGDVEAPSADEAVRIAPEQFEAKCGTWKKDSLAWVRDLKVRGVFDQDYYTYDTRKVMDPDGACQRL